MCLKRRRGQSKPDEPLLDVDECVVATKTIAVTMAVAIARAGSVGLETDLPEEIVSRVRELTSREQPVDASEHVLSRQDSVASSVLESDSADESSA